MTVTSLSSVWQGRCIFPDGTSFSMESAVPGSSIDDLIRAGRLPTDIFYRDHADAVAEYENCDFEYRRVFLWKAEPDTETILRFERLDTYCDITLNGVPVASTMDAHIPYEFDVRALLRDGENELRLYFTSPVTKVADMPPRRGAFTTERMNTRRIQCTYGWDWVGRFVSCGVPGDVTLIRRTPDDVRLNDTYIYTKEVDEESAVVGIELGFGMPYPCRVLTLRILAPDGRVCRTMHRYVNEPMVRLRLDIPSPSLWYPLGYGEQPMYTLIVEDGSRELYRERFGLRTVKIQQIPDEPESEYAQKSARIRNPHYDFNTESSGFILKINGRKILCRGANWVPTPPFYQGNTDEKITRTLELAAAAGVNMIRIWGGGTFESAHFYDECSRLGILVTQDFLMACGHYPEDEPWFIDCLRKEAEYAARFLRNKTCLVWYSGDNENAVNGCDTDADYSGRRSAYFGIAPALYRLDPYREFLPSSPFGGAKYASNTVGTTHNTQFLGSDILPYMLGGDCADYKEMWGNFRARFIAEEPQLGAISMGSLSRFMTVEDILGEDDRMWRYHTKTNPGLQTEIFDIALSFTKSLLGDFTDGADRAFKLRYLQYEWVRLTMEQLRREMWFQSGLIYWMLNDCWPAACGWAIMDYYNRPKDAYYAFKRCAKAAVLSLDQRNGIHTLTVSNTGAAIRADLTVYGVSKAGVREIVCLCREIPASAATEVFSGRIDPAAGEILVAEMQSAAGADRTFWRAGALPLVSAEVEMTLDTAAHTVTVGATGYVHAVELEADAIFEDNCFSLLPGERRTVSYTPIEGTVDAVTVCAYTLPEMV